MAKRRSAHLSFVGQGDELKRRASLILDIELLEEAKRILGTARDTEAIHLALSEVVNRDKRRRLAALEMPDLTLESLDQSRRGQPLESADHP